MDRYILMACLLFSLSGCAVLKQPEVVCKLGELAVACIDKATEKVKKL